MQVEPKKELCPARAPQNEPDARTVSAARGGRFEVDQSAAPKTKGQARGLAQDCRLQLKEVPRVDPSAD
jgi:hypothetical protein